MRNSLTTALIICLFVVVLMGWAIAAIVDDIDVGALIRLQKDNASKDCIIEKYKKRLKEEKVWHEIFTHPCEEGGN